MKKLLFILFAGVFFCTGNVSAIMIDHGEYTLDTTTGLRWLDYGSVQQEGFRLATFDEFYNMMSQMGLYPEIARYFYETDLADTSSEEYQTQSTLISLNLLTESWSEQQIYLEGEFPPGAPISTGYLSVLIFKMPATPEYLPGYNENDYAFWYESIFPAIPTSQQKSLWVSDTTPVPEPTTMLLFASGLLVFAGLGRKKFLKK